MTEASNAIVNPFTQSALDFVKSLEVSGDFGEVRESGMAAFESLPFPTRKTEDWKYTSLHALTTQDYNRPADNFDLDNASELFEVSGLDAYQLVFINGVFVSELSDEISEAGVSAVPLSVASDAQRALFKQHVGNIAETRRNLFTALNNATVEEGVLLHVEKNVQLKKPIQVVNITSAQQQTSSAFARCLVVLEQQAEATLIEQFVSTAEEQKDRKSVV